MRVIFKKTKQKKTFRNMLAPPARCISEPLTKRLSHACVTFNVCDFIVFRVNLQITLLSMRLNIGIVRALSENENAYPVASFHWHVPLFMSIEVREGDSIFPQLIHTGHVYIVAFSLTHSSFPIRVSFLIHSYKKYLSQSSQRNFEMVSSLQ